MTSETKNIQGIVFRVLTLAGLALIVLAYFAPVWWVSLKAPNYPAEAFPDGVRIHFHMNGVFNGCEVMEIAGVHVDEVLDCVHEMDAINHFVGMYPIAAGGVVERAFSPFLFALLGVMLAGFMVTGPKARAGVMAVGFAGVAGWMSVTMYAEGGIKYQNQGYLDAMVTSLGQGREDEGEPLSPIIERLRESLQQGGQAAMVSGQEAEDVARRSGADRLADALATLRVDEGAPAPDAGLATIIEQAKRTGQTGKALDIHILRSAFEVEQARKPIGEREQWTGTNWQVMYWHYDKALGRWFNNPEEIGPLVSTMKIVGQVVFWGVLAAMVFLTVASLRTGGLFYWVLVAVPILLPAFFIMEYAGWLWWYGHTLNDMGAFTLKPFMPTVLGVGKVAQFSTYSYPHYGFAMMAAASLLLMVAALLRRMQLKA